MNKNKIAKFGALAMAIFATTSCTRTVDYTVADYQISPGYVRYNLQDAKERKTEGYGAQFDTCIVEPMNAATDWELISRTVRESNLQSVRIRFYPEMYERGNDNTNPFLWDGTSENIDFQSAEMQHLYKLLDLFQECGVKVDLSWYGCRSTFSSEDGKIKGSWLGGRYGQPGINNWMMPPSDTYVRNSAEEYAESVAECLDYLINTKGYTCLYEYSLFPEPEGVLSPSRMDIYGAVAHSVKTRLQVKNINILYSGPADYGNNPKNLNDTYLSQGYPYDKATSSTYLFHGTVTTTGAKAIPSQNETMYEYAKKHVEVSEQYDLSWGTAESGTSNFITAVTNADTELFDRAMTLSRMFINFSNAGATNMKYFVYSDCDYDGALNQEGLFRYVKGLYKDSEIDYQAKPIWYAWSSIMRYTDFGSTIYPVTTQYTPTDDFDGIDPDVCIVALKLPDGSWSYFMANTSSEVRKVAIVNENEDRPTDTMKMFRLTEGTLPSGADATPEILAKWKDLDVSNGVAHVSIPANGIMILSNKA